MIIKPRTRKPASERKLEIVETAIRLAADLGPDRLSTQALADEIGISQPAIFRHFKTKGDIWQAVAEHISRAMKTSETQGTAPTLVLEKRVLANLAFISRTPAVPAILFSRELHAENDTLRAFFARLMSHNHRVFADLIKAGVKTGDLDQSINSDDAAYLILALIQGLAMRWSLSDRDFDLVDEGKRLLQAQMRAFR